MATYLKPNSIQDNSIEKIKLSATFQGEIDGKQNALVSGTNIKTINGNSILGNGDLLLAADIFDEITYSELKALRDGGELAPGMQYRITDYQCTTTQADTTSAGHQFDIIVVADGVNKLNENARAIQHSGDTYFADSNLGAWELKYCLDNDTDRFAWADTTNGKGVIYYMKDEWNNECPYDFKNIMFKRKLTDGEYDPENGTDTWVYTFTWINESDNVDDLSIIGQELLNDEEQYPGVSGNIIRPVSAYAKVFPEHPSKFGIALNDIVFISSYSYDEGLFYGCSSNTFEDDCFDNTFGNGCFSNTFDDNCHDNTFGNYCRINTFGAVCSSNTFGDDCYSITFGDFCYSNTFGDNCYSNTFGNNCKYNTCGNNCRSNTFGNDCHSNTFDHNCSFNTFGDNCYSNAFGSGCSSNTFGNDCFDNIFGNDFTINYCQHIALGDGVQYCKIYGSTTPVYTAYLQNIKVAQGLRGTSSSDKLAISVATGLDYETYVGKNSSGNLVIKNILN